MNASNPPLVERVRNLLRRRPETAQSLGAFLMLIDPATANRLPELQIEQAAANEGNAQERSVQAPPVRRETLIPVVGSTAAGPARFWSELSGHPEIQDWDDESEDRLRRLLAACSERQRTSELALVPDRADPKSGSAAALIQYSRPDELGLLEFLFCPELPDRLARVIAWRIDGDSMSPRYRDGDFVLVSPDHPAVDGDPCVAHLRGQIGVNCKIFKPDGSDLLLIPINEAGPIQRFSAMALLWANRVLFSVRLRSDRPSQ